MRYQTLTIIIIRIPLSPYCSPLGAVPLATCCNAMLTQIQCEYLSVRLHSHHHHHSYTTTIHPTKPCVSDSTLPLPGRISTRSSDVT